MNKSTPDDWTELERVAENEKLPGDYITHGNLSELTKQAAELKGQIDGLKLQLKPLSSRYEELCDTILKVLDFMELDNVRGHGYLFFKNTESSVTTPKTPEEKEELFAFLEAEGIFLEFASVNSQSLNKLYRDFAEKAAKDGNLDFKLPGVGEPTSYTTLKLRKG